MLTSMVVDLTLGTGTCVISGQNKGLVDSTGIDSTYFKLESQDKRPQIRRWRTYDSHRLASQLSQVTVKEVHRLSENIIYLWRGGLPADLQEKSWESAFYHSPLALPSYFLRDMNLLLGLGIISQNDPTVWPKHIAQAEEKWWKWHSITIVFGFQVAGSEKSRLLPVIVCEAQTMKPFPVPGPVLVLPNLHLDVAWCLLTRPA